MTSVRPAWASSMNSTAATTASSTPRAVRIDRGWKTTTTRPWVAPTWGGPGSGGRPVSGVMGSCSVTRQGVPGDPQPHRQGGPWRTRAAQAGASAVQAEAVLRARVREALGELVGAA